MLRLVIPVLLLGVSLLSGIAVAHEPVDEVIVVARAEKQIGASMSASDGLVGYDDILLPPLYRVGELLEAVPGLVATQHSGTGKANQYFVRGFNLDHGTDISAQVDGVPINLRSHGHGQGYLDLNFMIPELVETTRYAKGPYHAWAGDFSSAGAVQFDYYDVLEQSVVSLEAGEFGFRRALLAGSATLGHNAITGALDLTEYSGPWDLDEDGQMYKGHLAFSGHWRDFSAKLATSLYSGEWRSTDQIPQRAIDSGLVSRLGFVDPDLGGRTDRYALTASLERDDLSLTAYAIDYDFRLFSNFTYALDRPENGDEFEQADTRRIYGLKALKSFQEVAPNVSVRFGLDARLDEVSEVGLYDTVGRERVSIVRQDSLDEWSIGAWAEATWQVTDRLRVRPALRVDRYSWDVNAQIAANSGSGNDSVFSPSISAAWRVSDKAEIYLNWGEGFHSNDVRGITTVIDPRSGLTVDPVDALAQSRGWEYGVRWEVDEEFRISASVFHIRLDSELVFVGDAGTTEALDATRRNGVELDAFWQPVPWLVVNADVSDTRARFEQDQGPGRRIPGAVGRTASLSVSAVSEAGFFASLRGRYLDDAPLIEDGTVRGGGSVLVNLGAGYRWDRFEIRLDGFNLLDSDDADIAYWYASRLPGESAEGVEDVHLHPLEPRAFRASLSFSF